MGNENERKHDPAENRRNAAGHRFDDVKTGGGEQTVGQTGDAGFGGGGGAGAAGVGSGGAIGGSSEFLSGAQSREQTGSGSEGGPTGSSDAAAGAASGSDTKQVLTGDQEGDANFGGRTGSGTSATAANNSREDLGASGAGSPDSGEAGEEGFIGSQGDRSSDYLQRDGNPQSGFAEQGRGAAEGTGASGIESDEEASEPGGIEGDTERTANLDSDIEGSSSGGRH